MECTRAADVVAVRATRAWVAREFASTRARRQRASSVRAADAIAGASIP
jgi:hypothetical protein